MLVSAMFVFLAFPSMTTRTSWWRTFVRWPRPRSSWSFRAESIKGKVNSFLNFLDCNISCNFHYHFFDHTCETFSLSSFSDLLRMTLSLENRSETDVFFSPYHLESPTLPVKQTHRIISKCTGKEISFLIKK